MFTLKFFKNEPSSLDNEIERLLTELKDTDPSELKYATVSDQLVKLYKLKEVDSKERVSKDTMVAAGVNLAGILMVLHYEQAHVIASKLAASFVPKIFK